MEKLLSDFNAISGATLAFIALCGAFIVQILNDIRREITCLHEDFEAAHRTHSRFEE